jgi:signal recognition particle receptor subunit beta
VSTHLMFVCACEVLLLFANKQDVKGAMSVAEISDALALHNIKVCGALASVGFGLTRRLCD